MKKGATYIFLALFTALALFLRFYILSTIPQGFHTDELTAGYVGLKIIQTGKDLYGNFLPVYFNTFGDFRPTGIFYLSGISAFLFGLNQFAVRLPSALFGAIAVIGLYFLAKEIFKNKTIGLLSALLLTILPWHVVLSRGTSEGIIGLSFVIWGTYFLYALPKKPNKANLLTGSLLLFISMFFYHPFRIISPLLFIPLFFIKVSGKKIKRSIGIAFVILVLIFLLIATQKWGSGRLSQVAFYNNPDSEKLYALFYGDEKTTPGPIIRFYHNKVTIATRDLAKQVFRHTSPEYLFTNGGLPDRYSVPEQGLLYFFFIPFLLLAIIHVKKYPQELGLLLYFLFLGLAPAVITFDDTPNVHRSIFMMVPIVIMTAFGINTFIGFVKKQRTVGMYLLLILLTATAIFEVLYFWHQYTIHSVKHKVFARSDGFKEIAEQLERERTLYDKVYAPYNEQLPIYYLFFNKLDNLTLSPYTKDPEIAFQLNNIYFVKDWCASKVVERRNIDDKGEKIMIVDGRDCLENKNFSYIGRVTRTDGSVAFTVYKNR